MAGFTLLELIVAAAILALIAVFSWRGLDALVREREAITASQAAIDVLQRSFARIERDALSAADVQLDDGGVLRFVAGTSSVDGTPAASVEYRLVDGALTRSVEGVDRVPLVLLDHVATLSMGSMAAGAAWRCLGTDEGRGDGAAAGADRSAVQRPAARRHSAHGAHRRRYRPDRRRRATEPRAAGCRLHRVRHRCALHVRSSRRAAGRAVVHGRGRLMRSPSRPQRGVAIITALVVVAAATIAVSAMMWREAVAVRKLENQAALGEARWLARSAIEWARLVLLQDARTSVVDHLGEIWALPLAETRVTDDLGASGPDSSQQPGLSPTPFADNDAAWVSGRMRDAQARINLTGLAAGDKVDEQRLATLTRLVAALDLDKELPGRIASRMGASPRPASFDDLASTMVRAEALDASAADKLRNYLVILPSPTPVNVNTAPAEVLSALYEDLPLDAARALVRSREQAWFNQASDVTARLPGAGGQGTATNISVSSNYFEVDGRVRVGRADIEVVALIEREQGGVTRVRSLTER